ncbi:MAG TPA: ferritin [Armatimonadota bacterium]|jgi:ferritin
MLISQEMNAAINEEIGRELEASHLYLSLAAYANGMTLKRLSSFFFKQAADEREHALKFVNYVLDAGGTVAIPAVPAPQASFSSLEEAMKLALDWEVTITHRIDDLMKLAVQQQDFIAQDFLRWFHTEQLEEVSTIDNLLRVVKQIGPNVIFIEAYLGHA